MHVGMYVCVFASSLDIPIVFIHLSVHQYNIILIAKTEILESTIVIHLNLLVSKTDNFFALWLPLLFICIRNCSTSVHKDFPYPLSLGHRKESTKRYTVLHFASPTWRSHPYTTLQTADLVHACDVTHVGSEYGDSQKWSGFTLTNLAAERLNRFVFLLLCGVRLDEAHRCGFSLHFSHCEEAWEAFPESSVPLCCELFLVAVFSIIFVFSFYNIPHPNGSNLEPSAYLASSRSLSILAPQMFLYLI